MNQLKIGDTINLVGKTRAGQNKINRDGAVWSILEIRDYVPCLNDKGISIQSLTNDEKRWVKFNNDPDFEIIK